MLIARLEGEHRQIMEMAKALEAIVTGPRPETSGDFMLARWNFTREVLAHFSTDEALVVKPLTGDRRPHIAQLAAQSRTQLRTLYNDFERHMVHWKGLPSVEDWPQYRRDVLSLLRRLRARVATEESGIHHFLPVQLGERANDAPVVSSGWAARAG